MGNTNTKESRTGDSHEFGHFDSHLQADRSQRNHENRSRNRASRADFSFLRFATAGSSSPAQPLTRETREERHARRRMRDLTARGEERKRSLREEHIDGGYLVTMGTYTGIEDFNKPIVRQFQIERRLAPFWRGLQDFSETWTEAQLIAAAHGLPILDPDTPPPAALGPQYPQPSTSTSTDSSAPTPGPRSSSLSFKSRNKTTKAIAAALSFGSRNSSQSDLIPREVMLPMDPFINGQRIEVFLYKNAVDCPICFLYYPPYLNHTRCCDQPICSECFVQIKRPDPHFPDHHNEPAANPSSTEGPQSPIQDQNPELLVSEPATCPYCQQPEFGVTYDPPPFRRGLVYESSTCLGSSGMTSRSSVHIPAHASSDPATPSPPPSSQQQLLPTSLPPLGRRRTTSLSAAAPNVTTIDRIRPDWAAKLAAQRAHQARRAAAATALHAAAFLTNGEHTTGPSNGPQGQSYTEHAPLGSAAAFHESQLPADHPMRNARYIPHPIDVEEIMLREALQRSIASEEERRRKAEKDTKKLAKKRGKEEQKIPKRQSRMYPDEASHTNASGSSISLGPERNDSFTASPMPSITSDSTPLDGRPDSSVTNAGDAGTQSVSPAPPSSHSSTNKGRSVESPATESLGSHSSSLAPHQMPRRGSSHLRQVSNASSMMSVPEEESQSPAKGTEKTGNPGESKEETVHESNMAK